MIPSLSKTILALDWDSRHLRVLQCRLHRGTISVLHALAAEVPDDLKLDDPDAWGAFIAQALALQSIRTKSVIVSVPRQSAVLHALTLPPTPAGDVPGMVRFQLAQELPFSIEEAAVDYVVNSTSEEANVTGILAAAVRYEFIQFIQHVMRSAGLKLLRIDLRPHANLAAVNVFMSARSDEDRSAVFVDLGPDSTEVDIFLDQAMSFSRSVAVTIPVSEQPDDGADDQAAREPSEAMDELVLEVGRTMRAYRESVAAGQVKSIIVAGTTGWETCLAQMLSDKLKLPASVYQPSARIQHIQQRQNLTCAFSAVLGLALTQSRAPAQRFDFLHPKRPVAPGTARSRQVPIIAGAIALVMLAAFAYSRATLSKRKAEYARLSTINDTKLKELRQFQKFSTRLAGASKWVDKKVNWLEELETLSRLFPKTDEAYLSQALLTESSKDNIAAEISFSGQAKSSQVVDRLSETFVQGGHYDRVSPGQMVEGGRVAQYPHSFKLSLSVALKDPAKTGKGKTATDKKAPQAKPTESQTEQPAASAREKK